MSKAERTIFAKKWNITDLKVQLEEMFTPSLTNCSSFLQNYLTAHITSNNQKTGVNLVALAILKCEMLEWQFSYPC